MKLFERLPALGKTFHPETMVSRLVSHFVTENENLLGNETATMIMGALRARDLDKAVSLAASVPFQQYGTWQDHLAMNQLSLLIRKVPWTIPGLDTEANAWAKFCHAQHRCRRLNQRFFAERVASREPYAVYRARARKWIAKVIGETPDLQAIYEQSDYPSGAVVGIGGSDTSFYRKLSAPSISTTPSARSHFINAIWSHDQLRELYCPSQGGIACVDPLQFTEELSRRMKNVDYNEIFMVPKDSDCDRTAAKEPLANSFLQKGVDNYLKKKLRRVGLDLTRQEPNQRLAYAGSVECYNPFVTIDLTSASDSISIGLARDLLPPDWFVFLNQIRSPAHSYKGVTHRNAMFCTMGNGFCFPLETLIFASLIEAAYVDTGDKTYRVFGDDIIVRQSSALLVLELLRWAGFKMNKKKTFIFGPFRESCGADWYRGVNVHPYALDYLPSRASDLCRIHNGLQYNDNVARRSSVTMSFIRREIAGYPVAPQGWVDVGNYAHQALVVPMDVFMGAPSARWCRSTQTWTWSEVDLQGIAINPEGFSAPIYMYGLLRGSRPSSYRPKGFSLKSGDVDKWSHLPGATLRRKTRLRVT